LLDIDIETIFVIFDALTFYSSCGKPHLLAADLIQIACWGQFTDLVKFANLCLWLLCSRQQHVGHSKELVARHIPALQSCTIYDTGFIYYIWCIIVSVSFLDFAGLFLPGENVHLCSGDGQPKDSSPIPHISRVERKLKCTVEGCDRTFVWPAHFKYHLKTHRWAE